MCDKSFEWLNTALMLETILKILYLWKAFVLDCNLLNFILGAILSPGSKEAGEMHPVVYLS